ncbi:MAG: hypothetical protein ACI9CO_000047 [Candidatus Azotimanducaceae bacterium]|jgi:hypothetical protein
MTDEEKILKLSILLLYFEKQKYDPNMIIEIRKKLKTVSKRLAENTVVH